MPISIRRPMRASSNADLRRPTPKISMPVVLQSSTNLHLNEMMDLATAQKMMASRASTESEIPTPSTATEPELTDGSSASSSPTVEHNHLSQYFPGAAGAAAKAADGAMSPNLPQRVPSHSKREHERLARKRSLRGVSAKSPPSPTLPTIDQRTSLELIGVNNPEPASTTTVATKHRSPRLDNNAFSPELEKLTEAVEEQLKAQPDIEDADTAYMRKRGLVKFDVSDYCSDIGYCYDIPSAPFDAGFSIPNMAWI